ncbi:Tash protein PEST motif family [Yersinia similis]|uniref:Tash protein PEST motif family n=1 Tax=Yersinia similis TaxID=367190 RepID=A0ABN4CV00_9GAMM|nr:Tash protein PEST motif family [Yersinia similis]
MTDEVPNAILFAWLAAAPAPNANDCAPCACDPAPMAIDVVPDACAFGPIATESLPLATESGWVEWVWKYFTPPPLVMLVIPPSTLLTRLPKLVMSAVFFPTLLPTAVNWATLTAS